MHLLDHQEFDEDELEAELDALGEELELDEQEALDKQMLDIGPSVGLPDIPTAEPARPAAAKAPRKEEEDIKLTLESHGAGRGWAGLTPKLQ